MTDYPTHCAVCFWRNNAEPVEATQTVRNLRVCDTHADMVASFHGPDLAALFTAVRDGR